MGSILLLGGLGLVSTIGLALLAISKLLRPYTLSVLGLSLIVAQAFARNSVDAVKSFVDIIPYAFVMLGVQIAATPIAVIVFLVQRKRSRQRSD